VKEILSKTRDEGALLKLYAKSLTTVTADAISRTDDLP
jgi:hypothetical protein